MEPRVKTVLAAWEDLIKTDLLGREECTQLIRSLEQISRSYSPGFKSVVTWLLSAPGQAALPVLNGSEEEPTSAEKNIETLQRILGIKYADEFDSSLNHSDLLESYLFKELENARLVRLLCKFGFINERPEYVILLF